MLIAAMAGESGNDAKFVAGVRLRKQSCSCEHQYMPLHPNSSSAESDLVPEPADELGSFSWTKQWYPVARVEDLDESKPTPVSLFGKSLVL